MRNKHWALLCLAVLSSCVKEPLCPCEGDGTGEDQTYDVTVEMESVQVIDGTKSSFTDDDLNRITDLNVFIYHDGCLLEKYSRYFADPSSVMLTFPFDRDGFNIYMVGNVGEMEAPEDESEMCKMRYLIGKYDDFRVKGVPVANVFPDYQKGTLAHFRLKRLVGQYDITVRTSATAAEYSIKDVRLLNCALDVFPFSGTSKATAFTKPSVYGQAASGDVLTAEDIARLNAGETVSLYFVENLQGELLPGNTDRRKKIPSSLNSISNGLAGRCTYLEVTADVTTASAKYTDGKYRFYLGQNETTDFSIVRNTLYNVTLDFTQNMVSEQEWRIETGQPEVKPLVLSKEEAHILYGADDYILMSGPRMVISPESDLDDTDVCDCSLYDVVIDGKPYQRLEFKTWVEIDGVYGWSENYGRPIRQCEVILETAERHNGEPLLKKTVTVFVHDMIFPMLIRMGSNGTAAPYQVEVVTNAPVPLELEISATASVSVVNSGTTSVRDYKTAASSMTVTSDGLQCCCAGFPDLYAGTGTSSEKQVVFKRLDVVISGVRKDDGTIPGLYMGDGGKAYWGPGDGLNPARFRNLVENDDLSLTCAHFCNVMGCIDYKIKGGNNVLFGMAPKAVTCSSLYTTGTSNSLTSDINDYNAGKYIPFYVINGDLDYRAPVEFRSDEPAYLDNSGRVSIIYQMSGPGRDVFYPNGIGWGAPEKSPSPIHKFGYTAGLMKQFFGNIHTWQIYKGYECDFFMTVNGCTAWPWSSNAYAGFTLPDKL